MIDELTDCYQPFSPAKAVDSDEEPAGGAQVGDVVEVDGAQATIVSLPLSLPPPKLSVEWVRGRGNKGERAGKGRGMG